MIDLDRDALRKGITAAALVSVPAAVLFAFLDRDGGADDWVAVVFSLAVLGGLVLGAYVAGREQRTGTPMAHGLVTTVVLWLALTVIRFVRLMVDGDAVEWSPVLSNLLLSLVCGVVGGLLGGRRAARRSEAA